MREHTHSTDLREIEMLIQEKDETMDVFISRIRKRQKELGKNIIIYLNKEKGYARVISYKMGKIVHSGEWWQFTPPMIYEKDIRLVKITFSFY